MNRPFLSPEIPEEAWQWRNQRSVWQWCRQHSFISVKAQERWLEKIESDPQVKMFGIYREHEEIAEAAIPLGVCGFTSIDKHNQTAEFSLYIAPEHQGRGFAKIALTDLIKHGFRNLNFNRIWGEVFEGNPAMKLFEEIGFQSEGVLRESYFREGKFIDSTIISILRNEWILSPLSLEI